MKRFMVTGLPRSRTSWFANFLTYGDSMCFHDGFHGLDSIDDFPRVLEGFSTSGNSDPANLLFWEKIVEWFPDARWVVVKRPFEECLVSCNKILKVNGFDLAKMRSRMDDLIEAVNPMIVDFHQITPKVARNVADYLGVDAGPLARAEMLCRMNVQLDKNELRKALHNLAQKPPRWVSAA